MRHSKKESRPFLLLGHSLGGIICWEIAGICLKNQEPVPIVCAFDSWVVDNDKLDEKEVLNYLQVTCLQIYLIYFVFRPDSRAWRAVEN
jgi:hypothetical protein